MKKVIKLLIIFITMSSCSNAQKKEFSQDSMSKKLFTSQNKEVTFKEIISNHTGKTTVIEVWASWCSDCVKAMPKVKEMQANNPNVNYIFISMDKTFDKWIAGIEKHELNGDHYWVSDGMKGEFGKLIDVDWIPRYIILDKTGKIITYRAIETDFEQINQTLKNLE